MYNAFNFSTSQNQDDTMSSTGKMLTCFSVQSFLGTSGTLPQRTISGKIAWILLNLRNVNIGPSWAMRDWDKLSMDTRRGEYNVQRQPPETY